MIAYEQLRCWDLEFARSNWDSRSVTRRKITGHLECDGKEVSASKDEWVCEVVAGYLLRLDLRRFGLSCSFPFEDIAVLSRLRKLSLQRNDLQVMVCSILAR